jgi:hypothetical protein
LSKSGGWLDGPTPRQYAARIRRYADEIGQLAWASPQDRMFVRALAVSGCVRVRIHAVMT